MANFPTIEVTLSRYRCFTEESNATLKLEPGTTVAIVGKNNSGKSTLLRFFYEMKPILIALQSGGFARIEQEEVFDLIQSPIQASQQRVGLDDMLNVFPEHNPSRPVFFSVQTGPQKHVFDISLTSPNGPLMLQRRRNVIDEGQAQPDLTVVNALFRDTLYIGPQRVLGDGKTGGGTDYEVVVGTTFVATWGMLKNGPNTADRGLARRIEDHIATLLGYNRISIDPNSENSKLLLTIDGRTHTIAELGSGVAEVVLCIVAATTKKPSWILIDEPESHLHPALQQKFIAALESIASCGVIFTTHSIGLARTCAPTILTVRQDETGVSHVSQLEETPSYAQLMGELSFSQYHALGYNTLLLCEGVTEIKTLRQLLRKWGLDHNVMLVPLGGDALMAGKREAELDEFKRFGVPVYVLVDSERTAADQPNKAREKFGQISSQIFGSEHVLLTERRAMENYLTTAAIQTVKRSEKYTALSPYEVRKGKAFSWDKNENWKIAAEMSREDWTSTDIGKFLDRLLDPKPNNPTT